MTKSVIKAVILARVSDISQESGHSPDAQLANSRAYAERKGMEVLQVYSITESSTRGDRPEFERMIAFIGKRKERTALVVDCLDRLQRSFTHIPVLNTLMEKNLLEIHFVREGYSIDKDSNSTQKLMFNMGTLMAQSYVDQLKDNIKRSIRHKIDTGHWIAKAPVGYRHEYDPQDARARGEKRNRKERYRSKIVIDETRSHLVKRMFSEYATGTVSFRELQRKTFEWGLRTDKGNKLALQTVCDVISNPFYHGVMKVKGKLYRHNYPALIDKFLFDLCQAVRDRIENKPWKAVKQTRENFMLRGLITCAASGRKVTCSLQKGRYIYLMTRNPANPDQKLWIKEAVVLRQIREVFASFAMSEEALPEMLAYVRKSHEMEKTFHHEHVRTLQLEKNTLTGKLDRLTDLLLEGDISKEVYDRKHGEIVTRRDDINQQLAASDTGDAEVKMAISFIVSLVAKTPRLFESSKIEEKRKLLGLVFSNLQMEGSTLRYTLRKPFDLFAGTLNRQEWCALVDSNH